MLAEGLPKAVVFDLDGCLWAPDMYMLWGGGAPFEVREDGDLDDRNGARVRLLGAVRRPNASCPSGTPYSPTPYSRVLSRCP